jgi:hypothetical protein
MTFNNSRCTAGSSPSFLRFPLLITIPPLLYRSIIAQYRGSGSICLYVGGGGGGCRLLALEWPVNKEANIYIPATKRNQVTVNFNGTHRRDSQIHCTLTRNLHRLSTTTKNPQRGNAMPQSGNEATSIWIQVTWLRK